MVLSASDIAAWHCFAQGGELSSRVEELGHEDSIGVLSCPGAGHTSCAEVIGGSEAPPFCTS
jgi:hypothetical protein